MNNVSVLVTAYEAYPALETLFLNAQSKIEIGFRIFDPLTKLHSEAACEVGTNWADLIVATLERGVEISITLSDFDPITGYDLHRGSWKAMRILLALNEMTCAGATQLRARCLLHPAQAGLMPRLLLAAPTRKKLKKIADQMNEQSSASSPFRFAPRLRDALEVKQQKAELRPNLIPKIFPVTLHLKMALVDGKSVYIGGLDLDERRYDDQSHDQPAQDTWHDVQLIVQDDKIATDASAFLQDLPEMMAGAQAAPEILSAFRTTLSRKQPWNMFSLSPKPVSDGLLQEHLKQISAAREFIYIETQYFRDRRIAKTLAHAARRSPSLKLLLLLPAAPDDIAFDGSSGLDARFGEYLQAREIRRVRKAFGERFFVISPVQPRSTRPEDSPETRASLGQAPIVYVHAKVSIFDDKSAIVASANLNGRSMKWDVETGVVLTDRAKVIGLRDALFRHWLPEDADAAYFTPQTAFHSWVQLAKANAASAPDTRRGFVMPYDLAQARSAAMAIPGAPEELV